MYQKVPSSRPSLAALAGARIAPTVVYRSSPLALASALLLALAFIVATAFQIQGRFTHWDLRIVAHIVPARFHPRFLQAMHPLLRLGDTAFVVVISVAVVVLLWLRGYRRTWAIFLVGLSWPIELGLKAVLPQPAGLGGIQASMTVRSLVQGAGTDKVLAWLHQAAPGDVSRLVRHAGSTVIGLTSSYPSGTTARGAFVVGLLIWACLRLRVLVLSELLAVALLVPMAGLGFAVVLFAWHWPGDVLGGYLLGGVLLALSLGILRRPERTITPPALPLPRPPSQTGVSSHGPRTPLPWVRD